MTVRANPDDWDERYRARPSLWGLLPNRFVEERCRDLTPGRALDLACGEGRNAHWLASLGWEVTGIDFSPLAIERGVAQAQRQGLAVDFRLGDILTEPLAPEGYDLVLLAYVHLPSHDRATLLRRAREVVRPGGRFLLLGHDRRNLAEGHGGPTDASVLWVADEVAATLTGFDVIEAGTVLRPVDGAPRDAIDTVVHAIRPAA